MTRRKAKAADYELLTAALDRLVTRLPETDATEAAFALASAVLLERAAAPLQNAAFKREQTHLNVINALVSLMVPRHYNSEANLIRAIVAHRDHDRSEGLGKTTLEKVLLDARSGYVTSEKKK